MIVTMVNKRMYPFCSDAILDSATEDAENNYMRGISASLILYFAEKSHPGAILHPSDSQSLVFSAQSAPSIL